MKQPDKEKYSKDESAFDIESTLISIGDFDSVRCRDKRSGGGVKWIDITVERDGKMDQLRVTQKRMNAWKRKCNEEEKFTSIAYPIRDRLNEKLDEDV